VIHDRFNPRHILGGDGGKALALAGAALKSLKTRCAIALLTIGTVATTLPNAFIDRQSDSGTDD
jgi:hypothetical protein